MVGTMVASWAGQMGLLKVDQWVASWVDQKVQRMVVMMAVTMVVSMADM